MKGLRIQPDQLLVSEIFESVQGEGPSTGRPSTFLRLGLCNLACSWCDTAYTWDAKRFDLDKELTPMRLEAVAERVGRAANLVVTGGEPMLQQEALEALLSTMSSRVEVETAGTIAPSTRLATRVAQWNVSPKLASSGNPLAKRKVDSALAAFVALETAFFKLVIADHTDLEEADALIGELAVGPDRVWLMPEGTDAETLLERSRWLAGVCTDRGYHLGTRLHVLLWGDERGV